MRSAAGTDDAAGTADAAGTEDPTGPTVPDAADPVVAALLGRCALPPAGTPVVCAVSGGADSTALLALSVAAGCRVHVVHVDHALRPGSQLEAERVGRLAARWGATFRSETVPVPEGPDLEARARGARRSVLPHGTLFGHTADDQAETVLVRLLRGTGPSGLAAMRPDTHPLLALRRSDTVQLCTHLGVDALVDPSNTDPRFVRNRVRHEVLPLLCDVAGRDVTPLLCRLADLAASDAELVEALAEHIDPTDAAALSGAPGPVAAAAVRRWWTESTGIAHPPDQAATERVLAVASGRVRACDVVEHWRVARTGGRLRLERSTAD